MYQHWCAPQKPGNCNSLSAWLRPLVKQHSSFGAATSSLARFFRDQQAASAERAR